MNKLKALTDRIEAFNTEAQAYSKTGQDLAVKRDLIVAEASEGLGLGILATRGMLCKIKVEVTMPEPDAPADAQSQPQAAE